MQDQDVELSVIIKVMLEYGYSPAWIYRIAEIAQKSEGAMDLLQLWFEADDEDKIEVGKDLSEVIIDHADPNSIIRNQVYHCEKYGDLCLATDNYKETTMLIHNDEELELAIQRLDEVWSAKPWEKDYEERERLVKAIVAYEDENVHIPPPDSITAIKFAIEMRGIKPKDLIPIFGSLESVLSILSGECELTDDIIFKLHTKLGIPLRSLLGNDDGITLGEFIRTEKEKLDEFEKMWIQKHKNTASKLVHECLDDWLEQYEIWAYRRG